MLRKLIDDLRPLLAERFVNEFAHVDDAMDSILNNIAEGSGSIHPRKRRNFYDIAIGSAKEVRAGLMSLSQRGAFGGRSVYKHVGLTITVSKLLNAMILKLSNPN